jgi:uncharacterized membrane protein
MKGVNVATITESIEVNVPVETVYNQWTQFEEFPQFMDGVESVTQVDDTHLVWVAEVGGKRRDWKAEIVEQVPDSRIAWRALDGNGPDGGVSFDSVGPDVTKITVEMTYEPEGLGQQLGSAIGIDSRQVKGDLERFKELIESRGVETGAWRGEVRAGEQRN